MVEHEPPDLQINLKDGTEKTTTYYLRQSSGDRACGAVDDTETPPVENQLWIPDEDALASIDFEDVPSVIMSKIDKENITTLSSALLELILIRGLN